jgi:GTP-binding nuclear protein Ran
MAFEFKVLLVGDAGVGKSTFIQRHKGGEFCKKYLPNVAVNIEPLTWSTTSGEVAFNMWDCVGQEKFGCLRQGYYTDAQAAIIMFDVTAKQTYKNAQKWIEEIRENCGEIPIVLVGNKVDAANREVRPESVTLHKVYKVPYFELSVKSVYNYEKPFISLLRTLMGDGDLTLSQE